MEWWQHLLWLIGLIFIMLAFCSALFFMIKQNGDPTKTLAWLLLICVLPIIGAVLYFIFGKNFRRDKILSRQKALANRERDKIINKYGLAYALSGEKIDAEGSRSETIAKALLRMDQAFPCNNNEITILHTGKEKFKALFKDLKVAKKHIHVHYFIVSDDKLGNEFREMLIKKAKEGVEVRFSIDGLSYMKLSKEYIQSMKDAGVEVYPFLPVKFGLIRNKVNYRNHRKIVVIDGDIAYTGGMNVADRYQDGLVEIGEWHDIHIRIVGDSVAWLQAIFAVDRLFASNKRLNGDGYYMPKHVENKCLVQIVESGPDSDRPNIMHSFFYLITNAKKRINIATPYFIPNEAIMTALISAALRGVKITLKLSEKSDSAFVQWATLSYVGDLLDAGIDVFLYQKGFAHEKLMTIDGIITSVGTANMDIRSFEQDWEVNTTIYNASVTREFDDIFEKELLACKKIEPREWKRRPWRKAATESIAKMLSPLL